MKKNILFAFLLMLLCVTGITALQFYFTYTTYNAAEAAFKKDVNEALLEASDSTFMVHRVNVAREFRHWLMDTSYIKITSKLDPVKKTPVFTIAEKGANERDGGRISLSLQSLNHELVPLSPMGKKLFLDEMERTVKSQLKSGGVLYFTQELGKRTNKAYYETPINPVILESQYRMALDRRGISLPFTLAEEGSKCSEFATKEVNLGPRELRWMHACFTDVDGFLLGQLRWVIAGSLLLILITLACFWYTIKLLFSQQKLNALKDDFISNMTHEIHTPLTSILVTAEALKKFSHDSEARENYLDIIMYQGTKLTALTDELLTGARLEKTGIELSDAVDLNSVINDVLGVLQGHVRVDFLPTSDIKIRGNALHLARAIGNLADNAIKYNTADVPVLAVKAYIENNKAVITIADNGPGVPDSQKEKIFDQFYRIPSGNIHNIKGYGLGLSYVKKIVVAHKGSIAVKDNTGGGSIFIITLPL